MLSAVSFNHTADRFRRSLGSVFPPLGCYSWMAAQVRRYIWPGPTIANSVAAVTQYRSTSYVAYRLSFSISQP